MKYNLWLVLVIDVFEIANCGAGHLQSPGGGKQGAPPAAAAPRFHDDFVRPGVDASKLPKGISWGPEGEVQAGLIMTGRYGNTVQHTGLHEFSVYIRNRTSRTLLLSGPSFEGISAPSDGIKYTTLFQSTAIYSVPRIIDRNAKPVEVKWKKGTERLQFNLGPGQAALVSHWMLRTKPTQSKGVGYWENTQVAFVEPGKFRVKCEVSTS